MVGTSSPLCTFYTYAYRYTTHVHTYTRKDGRRLTDINLCSAALQCTSSVVKYNKPVKMLEKNKISVPQSHNILYTKLTRSCTSRSPLCTNTGSLSTNASPTSSTSSGVPYQWDNINFNNYNNKALTL